MLSGPLPPSPLPFYPAAWPPAACPRRDLFSRCFLGPGSAPSPLRGRPDCWRLVPSPVADESVSRYPSPLPSGGHGSNLCGGCRAPCQAGWRKMEDWVTCSAWLSLPGILCLLPSSPPTCCPDRSAHAWVFVSLCLLLGFSGMQNLARGHKACWQSVTVAIASAVFWGQMERRPQSLKTPPGSGRKGLQSAYLLLMAWPCPRGSWGYKRQPWLTAGNRGSERGRSAAPYRVTGQRGVFWPHNLLPTVSAPGTESQWGQQHCLGGRVLRERGSFWVTFR